MNLGMTIDACLAAIRQTLNRTRLASAALLAVLCSGRRGLPAVLARIPRNFPER